MVSDPETVSIKALKRPLFNRPSVRVVLVSAVGLYLFILCAAYFQRDIAKPSVSYAILGPSVVESEGSFPLRVVAYEHESRKSIPIRIVAASISDLEHDRKIDIPESKVSKLGLVTVDQAPRRQGEFVVKLSAEDANGKGRELEVPLTVYDAQIVEIPTPWETTNELVKGNAYHLELVSEGPGLIQGSASRVWVRVTHLNGLPAPGITVNWSAKGAEPSTGSISTDAGGLGYLIVTPQNLMTQFILRADGAAGKARMTQTLRPLGRSCMIWADRVLQAAGEKAIQVTVSRTTVEDSLYCDLYRGDAWLKSWYLPPNQDGSAQSKISVELPDADTFRLQCYNHHASVGQGSDVLWLFKRDQHRQLAVSELIRGAPSKSKSRDTVYRQAVPVTGQASLDSMMALFRSHHVLATEPALVASTRKSDIERANKSNTDARASFFLLIGASFGLILLWAIYTAIDSAIENRTRMAEAIEELGEMAVSVEAPTMLVRARTAVQSVFIVVILALFIIALLELFQHL